jgi:hypothetical protein
MEEELYITKKQVVQVISEYLSSLMNKEGYVWVKSKDEFVKKSNDWSLHICLNSKNFWPLKQEFNIPIYIVNEKINTIRMKFFSNVKKKDLLFHEWLVLPNSNELQYKELYTISDIEIAKKETYDLIKNKGLKYLEKYSNLDSVIEYSKEIKNSHFISILLIALRLSENNQYQKIKSDVLNHIFEPQNPTDSKQELKNLIEYLDRLK